MRLWVEPVGVRVRHVERVHVPERQQEATHDVVEDLVPDPPRRPWGAIRDHEPAEGVGAEGVDIAVPRDVDPTVAELDGCYLYDIDDLEAVVSETMAGRRVEAEHAERLVALEAQRFKEWRASLDVVPAIASLRARAEEIRAAELAKLDGLPDEERRTIDSVTVQILNKFLHLPTVRLKEAAARDAGREYADVVRDLFGLEDDR